MLLNLKDRRKIYFIFHYVLYQTLCKMEKFLNKKYKLDRSENMDALLTELGNLVHSATRERFTGIKLLSLNILRA